MFGPSVFPKIPEEVLAGQSRARSGLGEFVARRAGAAQHLHPCEAFARRCRSWRASTPRYRCQLPGAVRHDAADAGAWGCSTATSSTSRPSCFADDRAKASRRRRRRARSTLALRRATQREPTAAEIDRGLRLLSTFNTSTALSPRGGTEAVLPDGLQSERIRVSRLKMIMETNGHANRHNDFCGRTRREFLWEAGAGFTGRRWLALLDDDGFLASQAVGRRRRRASSSIRWRPRSRTSRPKPRA